MLILNAISVMMMACMVAAEEKFLNFMLKPKIFKHITTTIYLGVMTTMDVVIVVMTQFSGRLSTTFL
jgi:hypothetical protein